jgi:hypothetical protein
MIATVRLSEYIDSPSEMGRSQQARRLRSRTFESTHGLARFIPSSRKARYTRCRCCSVQQQRWKPSLYYTTLYKRKSTAEKTC